MAVLETLIQNKATKTDLLSIINKANTLLLLELHKQQ